MPRVSVLVPAFRPTYLRQAVASVLAQTFGDYELLISDDSGGSGVGEVLDEFRDARIKRLQGPRRGLVANSIFLVEQAGGEFLKFVYDDDFLLPFGLERLVTILDMAPEASFAFVFRHWVSETGRITHSFRTVFTEAPVRVGPAQAVNRLFNRLDNFVGEPNCVLLRRSALPEAAALGRYAGVEVRHLVDVALYLKAFEQGCCICIPEFHAVFRRHDDQTTSRANPSLSVGVMEWELFLRGETEIGRCSKASALEGVGRLKEQYAKILTDYPEVGLFKRGLPALAKRIEAGDHELVDSGFRELISRAHAVIADRAEPA